jgi:hypothetical protein
MADGLLVCETGWAIAEGARDEQTGAGPDLDVIVDEEPADKSLEVEAERW